MPLSLSSPVGIADPRIGPSSWGGRSAEFVVAPAEAPYAFSHWGEQRSFALRDSCLSAGKTWADTLAPVQGGDLRDTLTFIPKDGATSGWAKPGPRRSGCTAVSCDSEVVHEDLEARHREAPPTPAIYARDPNLQARLSKIQLEVRSLHGDALKGEAHCLSAALEVLPVRPTPGPGRLTERQLVAVRDYIEGALGGPISLSDLAGVLGLSRFHFSRAFEAAIGERPYRDVAARRVEAACRLLAGSRRSIEAVSSAVGFASTAQFRRAFQAQMAVSPLAFRRQV